MDVILLTIMILIAVICVAAAIVSIVSLVMYFIEMSIRMLRKN